MRVLRQANLNETYLKNFIEVLNSAREITVVKNYKNKNASCGKIMTHTETKEALRILMDVICRSWKNPLEPVYLKQLIEMLYKSKDVKVTLNGSENKNFLSCVLQSFNNYHIGADQIKTLIAVYDRIKDISVDGEFLLQALVDKINAFRIYYFEIQDVEIKSEDFNDAKRAYGELMEMLYEAMLIDDKIVCNGSTRTFLESFVRLLIKIPSATQFVQLIKVTNSAKEVPVNDGQTPMLVRIVYLLNVVSEQKDASILLTKLIEVLYKAVKIGTEDIRYKKSFLLTKLIEVLYKAVKIGTKDIRYKKSLSDLLSLLVKLLQVAAKIKELPKLIAVLHKIRNHTFNEFKREGSGIDKVGFTLIHIAYVFYYASKDYYQILPILIDVLYRIDDHLYNTTDDHCNKFIKTIGNSTFKPTSVLAVLAKILYDSKREGKLLAVVSLLGKVRSANLINDDLLRELIYVVYSSRGRDQYLKILCNLHKIMDVILANVGTDVFEQKLSLVRSYLSKYEELDEEQQQRLLNNLTTECDRLGFTKNIGVLNTQNEKDSIKESGNLIYQKQHVFDAYYKKEQFVIKKTDATLKRKLLEKINKISLCEELQLLFIKYFQFRLQDKYKEQLNILLNDCCKNDFKQKDLVNVLLEVAKTISQQDRLDAVTYIIDRLYDEYIGYFNSNLPFDHMFEYLKKLLYDLKIEVLNKYKNH